MHCPFDRETKNEHWRGLHGINAPKAAPVLEFAGAYVGHQDFGGGRSSSIKMRFPGPSRSSNWPLSADHQKTTPMANAINTLNGISRIKISIFTVSRF